eukprot:353229-Chlamydomonas_euryale.AAC.2
MQQRALAQASGRSYPTTAQDPLTFAPRTRLGNQPQLKAPFASDSKHKTTAPFKRPLDLEIPSTGCPSSAAQLARLNDAGPEFESNRTSKRPPDLESPSIGFPVTRSSLSDGKRSS